MKEPMPRSSGPSNLLVILLIAVSFFAGYLFFKVKNFEKVATNPNPQQAAAQPQAPQRPTELKIRKPDNTDHWRGDKNSRYIWVEYSDLECPFCKKIHPDLVKVMNENKDKVAWVFRHYPLPFHQNAQKEAEAVECANDLGGNDAFWNMNDKIFERTTANGTGFALDQLGPLAAELGLDQNAFQQCLDTDKFAQKVKDQSTEGTAAGVQATPTGVIYDMKTGKTKLVEGAVPYDSLKTELENFIKSNS